MTKRERQDREWMRQRVLALGFTDAEFDALRRISMTLHRWHEHECNGNIQREGDRGDGLPRWHSRDGGKGCRIADKERGALKRLAKLMEGREGLLSYVQGDPRGAALYLVPASELRGQPIESVYSRGVAIY